MQDFIVPKEDEIKMKSIMDKIDNLLMSEKVPYIASVVVKMDGDKGPYTIHNSATSLDSLDNSKLKDVYDLLSRHFWK